MNVMTRCSFLSAGSSAALHLRGAENSANRLQLRILGRGIHIIDADGVHAGQVVVTGPGATAGGGGQGAIDGLDREGRNVGRRAIAIHVSVLIVVSTPTLRVALV